MFKADRTFGSHAFQIRLSYGVIGFSLWFEVSMVNEKDSKSSTNIAAGVVIIVLEP